MLKYVKYYKNRLKSPHLTVSGPTVIPLKHSSMDMLKFFFLPEKCKQEGKAAKGLAFWPFPVNWLRVLIILDCALLVV